MLDETQREGTPRRPRLSLSCRPSRWPQSCGLSTLQEGGTVTHAVQGPGLGDQLQTAGHRQLQKTACTCFHTATPSPSSGPGPGKGDARCPAGSGCGSQASSWVAGAKQGI